jgi:hypothetical protein
MNSPCEFDLLDFPNYFQLELKISTGIRPKYEGENFIHPQNTNYKIKNKIPVAENEKCAATGMIIKILKNVKISQEKVMMELNPTWTGHGHNQTILDKIKPIGLNLTQNQKNPENSKLNSNDEQRNNLMPGIKRK